MIAFAALIGVAIAVLVYLFWPRPKVSKAQLGIESAPREPVLQPAWERLVERSRMPKRQRKFAEQLPDVLQLLITTLRAGFGLTQALDAVTKDAEEPSRTEWEQVLTASRMGQDMAVAMRALAERMGCPDLAWIAGAVEINRDTGGNLAEVLSNIQDTIRSRARMRGKIRTLTAEGRLSARILTALPLVVIAWQAISNPDRFSVFLHGAGPFFLGLAGVLMIVGWFWIRRIVTIKL
jgi:tight adherence protein B